MSIIIFLFGCFAYLNILETQNIALSDSKLSIETKSKLLEHTSSFMGWMAGLCFVVAIALVVCGILTSHKIAGPLVKLKGFLKQVAEGDFSQQIAFRRKDQLDEFADVLNETVSSLDARKAKRKSILEELSQRTDSLESALSAQTPDRESATRMIGEIRLFFSNLKDCL